MATTPDWAPGKDRRTPRKSSGVGSLIIKLSFHHSSTVPHGITGCGQQRMRLPPPRLGCLQSFAPRDLKDHTIRESIIEFFWQLSRFHRRTFRTSVLLASNHAGRTRRSLQAHQKHNKSEQDPIDLTSRGCSVVKATGPVGPTGYQDPHCRIGSSRRQSVVSTYRLACAVESAPRETYAGAGNSRASRAGVNRIYAVSTQTHDHLKPTSKAILNSGT